MIYVLINKLSCLLTIGVVTLRSRFNTGDLQQAFIHVLAGINGLLSTGDGHIDVLNADVAAAVRCTADHGTSTWVKFLRHSSPNVLHSNIFNGKVGLQLFVSVAHFTKGKWYIPGAGCTGSGCFGRSTG